MNIRAALLVVVLATVTLSSSAEDDYEYEDGVPAQAALPVKPLRPSPLLRQARGPVVGRPAPKATVTQKTTEAPPPEYDEEELEEEFVSEEEEATTTTEAPKRGFKNGVVRPFRSNTDLIEALKRRRQQNKSGSSSLSTTTTTTQSPVSEKTFKGGRRGSSNKINSAADQTGSTSERKTSVNGRRFSPRGGKVPEGSTELEPAEEEQPSRSRLFGRGRKF